MGRLTSKGQVTIPKKVREYLDLKPGDAVEFRVEQGRVIVRPVNSAVAWEAGKNVFGRHSSGRSNGSQDRKRLLKDKLRGRRSDR